MARAARAELTVEVALFAFDPDAATTPQRAVNVLVSGTRLPRAEVAADERLGDAAERALAEAGLGAGSAPARRSRARVPLRLLDLVDRPGAARTLTVRYYGGVPLETGAGAVWTPAMGRGARLEAASAATVRTALDRLRQDTRAVGGAAALLGDVFTGDDLLRVHVALHGGPRGSERTFRRRVQELRDAGVLRPVRDTEVAALRVRYARFRSQSGTGGRPPELLRYAGSGGDEEQLTALRARRSA